MVGTVGVGLLGAVRRVSGEAAVRARWSRSAVGGGRRAVGGGRRAVGGGRRAVGGGRTVVPRASELPHPAGSAGVGATEATVTGTATEATVTGTATEATVTGTATEGTVTTVVSGLSTVGFVSLVIGFRRRGPHSRCQAAPGGHRGRRDRSQSAGVSPTHRAEEPQMVCDGGGTGGRSRRGRLLPEYLVGSPIGLGFAHGMRLGRPRRGGFTQQMGVPERHGVGGPTGRWVHPPDGG